MKEIDLSPDHTVCTPEGIQTGTERKSSCSISFPHSLLFLHPPAQNGVDGQGGCSVALNSARSLLWPDLVDFI